MRSRLLTATDEELKAQFTSLYHPRQIAQLLEVDWAVLTYLIYRSAEALRYTQFEIPKKDGSPRRILSPNPGLKKVQRKLAYVLNLIYRPKAPAHGFILGRSICTNAAPHVRRKSILNIDIKDFFPSVNFGRVRGLLIASPYGLRPEVATVIAQICCFRNELPQGAPTSPIISNMICGRMDGQLSRLARENKCFYTRYADDLSFSTGLSRMSTDIVSIQNIDSRPMVILGEKLQSIITTNGFRVNERKIRFRTSSRRLEVTGLTVNRFPNVPRSHVRQVRAMLHAWERYGYEKAEHEFRQKFDKKYRRRDRIKSPTSFIAVVQGKLEYIRMVRGDSALIYKKLLEKYNKLVPADKRRTSRSVPESIAERLSKAIWVVEDDDYQGTAFFLDNTGIITCDHALSEHSKIFQPGASEKFSVKIIKRDKERDIAILESPPGASIGLKLGDENNIKLQKEIFLAGYPNWAPEKECTIESGQITNLKWMRNGITCFKISPRIVDGASGSPVIDKETESLIGIAAFGGRESDETIEYGVISVVELKKCLDGSDLTPSSSPARVS